MEPTRSKYGLGVVKSLRYKSIIEREQGIVGIQLI